MKCDNCKGKGKLPFCRYCYTVKKDTRPAKTNEIKELWSKATLELWEKDRRKYLELIKEIKRKESRAL
jgi:hypothetical protein